MNIYFVVSKKKINFQVCILKSFTVICNLFLPLTTQNFGKIYSRKKLKALTYKMLNDVRHKNREITYEGRYNVGILVAIPVCLSDTPSRKKTVVQLQGEGLTGSLRLYHLWDAPPLLRWGCYACFVGIQMSMVGHWCPAIPAQCGPPLWSNLCSGIPSWVG